MDTFGHSKRFATIGLMLGLFAGGSNVLANPQISPIDPMYYTQDKPTGTGKQSKKELLPETTSLSTTYTTVNGNETGPLKLPHAKKKFSIKKHDDAGETEISTKVEKIKVPKENSHRSKEAKVAKVDSTRSDDGIVGGTKAASSKIGGEVANGTKKVGDGLTSGAKASSQFFMKGAKAIGSGFKGSDKEKISDSSNSKKAKSGETKIAEKRVKEDKHAKDEPKKVARKTELDDQEKSASKVKEKAKVEQNGDKKTGNGVLSPISKTLKGTVDGMKDGLHAATDKLSITKPESKDNVTAQTNASKSSKSKAKVAEPTYLSHGKPVKKTKAASGPGLVSKTLGKLPFIGGSKKNEGVDTSKVARSSDSDELVTDTPVKSAGRKEEESLLGPSL